MRPSSVAVLVGLLMLLSSAGCSNKTSPGFDANYLSVEILNGGDSNFTALGGTKQLKVLDGPSNDVTAKASFTSSAPGVVSVSSTGVVKSLARGQASVTATYAGKQASIATNVYLLASLAGTWHVEFSPLQKAYLGTMTMTLTQDSSALSGTFSGLKGGLLDINGHPGSGTVTGTITGTYDKQTVNLTLTAASLPDWGTCALTMSSTIREISGTSEPTSFHGDLNSFIWCISNDGSGAFNMSR